MRIRIYLSGGLGEPHQGGRPSVSFPPLAAAWLFPANNKVIYLLIVPVVLCISVDQSRRIMLSIGL